MNTIINNYFEFDEKVALINSVYSKAVKFFNGLKKDEILADVINEVKHEPIATGMVVLTGVLLVCSLYLMSLIQAY